MSSSMRINSSSRVKTTGGGTRSNPFTIVADVSIQDQTTKPLILPLAQQLGLAELSADAVLDSFTVTVTNTTGATVGSHFRIINSASDRYYFGEILAINGLTLTLDTGIDFTYVSGSEVTYSNINMAVNGSVTPVHFHLRTGSPSIPSSLDITRLIMTCECTDPVNLSTFGDIEDGLDRGLVLRTNDTETMHNVWNVKTSNDLLSIGYDLALFDASNPVHGRNGFAWRLTFGGQSKIGVVLRVSQFGQLGIIVQDDLTSLIDLKCMVEGHAVED